MTNLQLILILATVLIIFSVHTFFKVDFAYRKHLAIEALLKTTKHYLKKPDGDEMLTPDELDNLRAEAVREYQESRRVQAKINGQVVVDMNLHEYEMRGKIEGREVDTIGFAVNTNAEGENFMQFSDS